MQGIRRCGLTRVNEGFFESRNFSELDYIQRRVERQRDAATEREREATARRARQETEKERRRQEAAEKEARRREMLERKTPCRHCVREEEWRRGRHQDAGAGGVAAAGQARLRRPLAPRCTCMDPTDGSALPVLPVEYPVDVDDWACRPFSTVASGGAVGYRRHFPLLMQRCTESEEKDSTQVQTETRRRSVVTTDYQTGRIRLEGTDGCDIHVSVFPALHVVLSSEEEDEDEAEEDENGESASPKDTEDGRSLLETLHAMRTQQADPSSGSRRRSNLSRAGPAAPQQPPRAQQRRRSSSAAPAPSARPAAGRASPGGPRCRVIRRRSLDQGALALSFASALEAASDAMAPIAEGPESRPSPAAGFDEKHAEETMVHLAQNLHTLEEFLKSSTSSCSEGSSSDSDV